MTLTATARSLCSSATRRRSIATREPAALQVDGARRAWLKGTGALALSGFTGTLLAGCGGSISDDAAPTPRLASVANFRDVGGAAEGYVTVDGARVQRGRFYRSSALTANAADKAVLDTLTIAVDYDLRTPGEVAQSPDVMPAGAAYVSLNIDGTSEPPQMLPATSADAVAMMEALWRSFVSGEAQRTGFGTLLTRLANTPGAQLFHCDDGKDISGWVSAVLLSIANVPFDVVMQDYLLSNTYLAASTQTTLAVIRAQQGDAAATAAVPLHNAQASFLQAAVDQVQASYGTMNAYLTTGLGLSQATVGLLHARLIN
ncbi:tyrosine-protein phosphatase [Paraburkholderia sp.]|uniref:tyrosine-protein phosphatase n=1 Tax=Paraburkholderia sp. TaxID=1926495 RepID=UPI003D6F45B3